MFQNSARWIELNKDKKHFLPKSHVLGMNLEAVDLTNTRVMYESFENFGKLVLLRSNLFWTFWSIVLFEAVFIPCPCIRKRGFYPVDKDADSLLKHYSSL